jgi:hypothetical protein
MPILERFNFVDLKLIFTWFLRSQRLRFARTGVWQNGGISANLSICTAINISANLNICTSNPPLRQAPKR